MEFAVLIHGASWKYPNTEFELLEDVKLINLNESPILSLYHRLCKKRSIDDGDPFLFETALIIKDDGDNDYSSFPSEDKSSTSTFIVNLLAIIVGYGPTFCRVISSKNNFKTSWNTFELYLRNTVEANEVFISDGFFNIDIDVLTKLKIAIQNFKNRSGGLIEKNEKVCNALDYFYLAWRSGSIEECFIFLSIVLESLFSPPTTSEIIHQISFNVSKFLEDKKEKRVEVYKQVKKFYSIRSKIVHGDVIDWEKMDTEINDYFNFVSQILSKIILDKNLTNTFNVNSSRTQFLQDLAFE